MCDFISGQTRIAELLHPILRLLMEAFLQLGIFVYVIKIARLPGISHGEMRGAHESGFNLCAALEYQKAK